MQREHDVVDDLRAFGQGALDDAEVAAGHEAAAGTFDHDDAQVWLLGEVVHRGFEGFGHLDVERVELGGAVEGDGGDGAFGVQD